MDFFFFSSLTLLIYYFRGGDKLLFNSDSQFWILVIGSLVPLVTYLLNHVLPVVDEKVKALITVVVSAAAAALFAAIDTDVFGWNNATLQLVLSGVVATLLAHQLLWKPAKVNVALGAKENSASQGPVDAS
jgi:peptidoglycan/LPS O-acetylase OafA/YrhL